MTPSEDEKAVARWMPDQYRRQNRLVQSFAARGIRMTFGEHHAYKNYQRNWESTRASLRSSAS